MNLKETNGKLLLNGKEIPNTLNECFSEQGMEIPDKQPGLCPMCLNMQGSGNLSKLLPNGNHSFGDNAKRIEKALSALITEMKESYLTYPKLKEPTKSPEMATVDNVNRVANATHYFQKAQIATLLESLAKRLDKVWNEYDRNGFPGMDKNEAITAYVFRELSKELHAVKEAEFTMKSHGGVELEKAV